MGQTDRYPQLKNLGTVIAEHPWRCMQAQVKHTQLGQQHLPAVLDNPVVLAGHLILHSIMTLSKGIGVSQMHNN